VPSRRPWQGLRRLTGDPQESRIFAFDTETCADPWNPEQLGVHRFLFGCVYDGARFYDFLDREKMAAFLCSRKWSGWQGWSCNLEYDLNAIFREPTWPLYRSYFGGLLKGASLTVRAREEKRSRTKKVSKGETVHLFDTLNHWRGDGEVGKRGGVAAYGRIVGLPKLEHPIAEIGPAVTEKLRTYCQRDAEIVWRMVTRMRDQYLRLGANLKGSIAATALDLFRRRYLAPAHEHRKLPPAFVAQAREAYYGARTENFRVGQFRDVFVTDVNSMYPSVMATQAVPLFDRCSWVEDCPDTGEGFGLFEVEVPDCEYPPLPFRWGKLYFPTGRWVGSFVLPELRHAIACGVKVHRCLGTMVFPKSAVVFADYVGDLYARRVATQDTTERLAYKSLLTNLYGKFGQQGEVVRFLPSWEEEGVPTKLGWRIARTAGEPAPYANFLWAAYITAGARVRLHTLLVEHGAIYCDTDSLFTFTEVPKRADLGALSLKYLAEWVTIRAPKVYATDRETRIKGVRGASGLALDGRFTFRKPSRFRESTVRGIAPNTWAEAERHLAYTSDKRRFAADGTSRPLTVGEITSRRLGRVKVGHLVPGDPEGKSRESALLAALG
jgi:hypothetical protein